MRKNDYFIYSVIPLGITSIFILFDIIEELSTGLGVKFIILEIAICISSFVGFFRMLRKYINEKDVSEGLNEELTKLRSHSEQWKKKVKLISHEFSHALDQQLEEWGLSITEKEIAVLLMKGMSAKEIATLRKVSDKTVRTHLTSVYKKSKLNNRYELAAYFIDGLVDIKLG